MADEKNPSVTKSVVSSVGGASLSTVIQAASTNALINAGADVGTSFANGFGGPVIVATMNYVIDRSASSFKNAVISSFVGGSIGTAVDYFGRSAIETGLTPYIGTFFASGVAHGTTAALSSLTTIACHQGLNRYDLKKARREGYKELVEEAKNKEQVDQEALVPLDQSVPAKISFPNSQKKNG